MFRKRFGVDVRTAHYDTNTFAIQARAERIHERGQGSRSRRLDGELRRAEKQSHRVTDLVVAYENNLVDKLAVQRERIGLASRRTQRVGDRANSVDRLRCPGPVGAGRTIRAEILRQELSATLPCVKPGDKRREVAATLREL